MDREQMQRCLDVVARAPKSKPIGFVAARVAPGAMSAMVRMQMSCGATRLDLHWPLAHTLELAALMRELGR